MVREKLPEQFRMTLSSLIVTEVNARDIVENLARTQTKTVDDFNWVNKMRYYFEKDSTQVKVSMVMTNLTYNNEYLGNTGRLVITPLTDRCYRTLMSALTLNLGGAPEGPAGTGKTETTKDLAKAVAIHCLVFNCGEGLNAKFMSKFFKGLASGGSWSCFDEFNRIDLEVLSVIAQQILEIQSAKNRHAVEFMFEDTHIRLQENCNIFITMNPDYAGRSQLPDNLKALFRPVAMMIPDYSLISEISLYSFGFMQSRVLAKKIVQTYRLCSEQLSTQYHYDYGMRAVKAVLTAAKNMKHQQTKTLESARTKTKSEPVEEPEDSIILRSIRDVNMPKFLAEDIPLFEGIINDLFQGQTIPVTDYPGLRSSLQKAISTLNL
jgi:dynein heavy chain